MSVFIKKSKLRVKNEDGTSYTGVMNAIAEESTEELIKQIEAKGEEVVAKGKKTLESIPEDYTVLEENVDELKEDIVIADLLSGGRIKEYFDDNTHGIVTNFLLKSGVEYTFINNSNIEFNGFIDGDFSTSKIFYFGTDVVKFTPKISGRFSAYKNNSNSSNYIDLIVLTGNRKEIEELKDTLNTIQTPKKITVKQDGTGDYTTFTEAIKSIQNDTTLKEIYVYGGDYNVFEEIGGKSFTDTIVESDLWENVNTIIPPNTTIIGVGKVNILYQPLDSEVTNAAANLISPINMRNGDVSLKNLTIKAKNCRYAIHDEGGDNEEQYTHIYENVKVIKNFGAKGKSQAFGCGIGFNARLFFNDSIFKGDKSPVFSIHNNLQSDLDSSYIHIENTIIDDFNSGNNGVSLLNTYRAENKERMNKFICCNSYIANKLILGLNGARSTANTFEVTAIGCNNFIVDEQGLSANNFTPIKQNIIN